MTRETRIALLVGLAFIVLFGLVLGQRSMNLQSQSPTLATKAGPAGAANSSSLEENRPSNELAGSTIPDSAHTVSTAAPSHADVAAPRADTDAPPSRVNPSADAHLAVAPSAGHTAAPTPSAEAVVAVANPAEGRRAVVTETAKTADSGEKNVIDIAGTDDSSGKTYKVQAGDNIFKIAKKLNLGNGGPSKIMAMNKDRIKNFTAIQVGHEILVPADDTAKVTPAKADASKNDLAANLANAAAVKKPAAADAPAAVPAPKAVLASVDRKPADDKPVLAATSSGKGDVDGTLAKPRDDMKAATPADKTDKSASLDKLDDKLNGKADAAVASKTYKVRAGDSLYSIAGDQMGSHAKAAVQKLMQANGIKDPSKLAAGSELKIPKA